MKKSADGKDLTIQFEGRAFSGSWSVSPSGVVAVTTANGYKSMSVGAGTPEAVAKWLLYELAAEEGKMK